MSFRKWHRLMIKRSALAFAVAALAAPVAQASVASDGGSPAVGVNSGVIAPDDYVRTYSQAPVVSSAKVSDESGGVNWTLVGLSSGVGLSLLGAGVALARSRQFKPLPQH